VPAPSSGSRAGRVASGCSGPRARASSGPALRGTGQTRRRGSAARVRVRAVRRTGAGPGRSRLPSSAGAGAGHGPAMARGERRPLRQPALRPQLHAPVGDEGVVIQSRAVSDSFLRQWARSAYPGKVVTDPGQWGQRMGSAAPGSPPKCFARAGCWSFWCRWGWGRAGGQGSGGPGGRISLAATGGGRVSNTATGFDVGGGTGAGGTGLPGIVLLDGQAVPPP